MGKTTTADSKAKTVIKIILEVLLILLFAFSVFFLLTVIWGFDVFKNLKLDEVLFHLAGNLEGSGSEMLRSFYLRCVLPSVVVTAIAVILLILRRKKSLLPINIIVGIITIGCLVASFIIVEKKFAIVEYLAHAPDAGDDFIAQHYVEPRDVKIDFPEEKRNLVFIFLESVEATFADESVGGAFPENCIPELTRLALDNETFCAPGEKLLNGGVSLSGATWTMGAMFAETTGLPLKTSIEKNSMESVENFYPGATGIGDILKEQGYDQELMIGSDASFGGRRKYFSQHGEYDIFDYYTAIERGFIPEDYYVFWGYEDRKLFEYAKQDLTDLAKKDEPFNFTLLTVDTHFEDGYVCELCRDEFEGNQYANVMACSSRQVTEFVHWIQQQDFYENTTIVISGDHPTMDNDFCLEVPADYSRKVYFTIINSAKENPSDRGREFTTMDVFPTTLEAMGADIEGGRLALGTSLYSGQDTLLETYGYEENEKAMEKKSEFMKGLYGRIPISSELKETVTNGDLVIYGYDLDKHKLLYGYDFDSQMRREGLESFWTEFTLESTGETIVSDEMKIEDQELTAWLHYHVTGETVFEADPGDYVEAELFVRFDDGTEMEVTSKSIAPSRIYMSMADYLRSWDTDRYTLFIAAMDEASMGIQDKDVEAFASLGITLPLKDSVRGSFYAITGRDILEESLAYTLLTTDGTFDGDHKYKVVSAGYDAGNTVSIEIDGTEYAREMRGLNIVVYDCKNDKVVDTVVFDSYENTDVRSYQ